MQKTHVVMLLDESGSMGIHRRSVVNSFNSYVNELKNGTKRCFLSLCKFDQRHGDKMLRTVFENRKVRDTYPLTMSQYQPHGGTPLFDAIGKLIKRTRKRLPKKGMKVLFVVHTDGQENASRVYNQEDIKRMIRKCEKRGWTFVYLGEGAEAWNAGYDFGIQNVANFSSSLRGASMEKLATATVGYACNNAGVTTQSFYADSSLTPDDIDPNDSLVYSSTVTNADERATSDDS